MGAPLPILAFELQGRTDDIGEVDAFVLGARDIAAALLDLARATQLAPPGSPVHDATQVVVVALLERVKALAPLST